ncbi:MAG: bifunctional nuclease domain-containing protein [Saprospiraceae bacterium]
MQKIELSIVALSHSVPHSNNYAIVLGEVDGLRRLPIVIGGFEAQAIAVAMERMTPNRPLTHDLFKTTMDTFHIQLKEVLINDLVDGVFYAKLICEQNSQSFEVDSRTSDALALAVRYLCPIYTYDFILESAGVVLDSADADPNKADQDAEDSGTASANSFGNYSLEALQKLLEEVLGEEDYEKAARIRDEINRRKKDS